MKKVPYLSSKDIEDRVESRLLSSSMMPTPSKPILDLPLFVEMGLKANLDDFCPLPSDVMGEVIFQPNYKDQVNINRDLSEQAESDSDSAAIARARLRSTIAHEAGHIILHREILMPAFDQGTLELFDSDEPTSSAYAYRCLKSDFASLSQGRARRPSMNAQGDFASRDIDHMEIQANKAMSALLLPRNIFSTMATDLLKQWESARGTCSDYDHFQCWQNLVTHLSQYFEVSRQVVTIRIKMLNLLAQSKTLELF